MRDSFIFHLYTNMKSVFIQQILSGSSFVSPALGVAGQGGLNINDNFPPKKIWAKPESKRTKRERVWGEGIFARPRLPTPIFPPPPNFVFRFAKCVAKRKDVALVPPAHTRATIRNSPKYAC